MKLGIYNVWTTVEEADAGELAWLRATLSVRVKRARGQEGTETFLHEHTKPFPLFPTGWLRSVQHFAKSQEGAPETTITDHRVKPCAPRQTDLTWLHPYQVEAVQIALQRGRGLIQMPTGSGKSEMMAAVIMSIPCPCLILIRDRSLLAQLASTYHRRSGKTAGLIGDGRWSEGYVTVAMVQSIDSFWDRVTKTFAKPVQEFLMKFGTVIADEAHGAASETAMRILESMHNAYYRIGFSATMVGRSDMRDGHVISNFGRIIHQRSDTEIEELGKIATAEIRIHRLNQPGIPGYADGGYTMGISRSQARNHLVARIWQKAAKPCLTYVREIEHGRVLLDMAEKMGLINLANLCWETKFLELFFL
jgi:superfamily II DNA or RNA helicase